MGSTISSLNKTCTKVMQPSAEATHCLDPEAYIGIEETVQYTIDRENLSNTDAPGQILMYFYYVLLPKATPRSLAPPPPCPTVALLEKNTSRVQDKATLSRLTSYALRLKT